MSANMLKLNSDKTELITFAPKHKVKETSELSMSLGSDVIHEASFVKNLGAFFDKTLSMEKQCNETSRACYMQIRKIGRIRPYLTDNACKTVVHSLVTSR